VVASTSVAEALGLPADRIVAALLEAGRLAGNTTPSEQAPAQAAGGEPEAG
jgi:hypothetical protein